MNIMARTMELRGSSYDIGRQLGRFTKDIKPLKELHTTGMEGFGDNEVKQAAALFEAWCPGLDEELQGFADELGAKPADVFYYGMTYLRPRPRCSHMALLPRMTECGRTLVARNYEFNNDAEDFALIRTEKQGRYTHMGSSVLHFGRDDGFNEHGLAVTISSCGFPVGPMPYMRAPKLDGLQFWAVTRALLENCRDVAEALAYMKGMPIAYNLNMLLADKGGNIALVETLDGRMAVQHIGESGRDYLHATNHPVIPELVPYEPQAMRHSLMRYNWISEQLEAGQPLTAERLKAMLLSEFPDGLCCHYYQDYFGTTKSMVIDPARGTIDICWGGDEQNGWRQYDISKPLEFALIETNLRFEKFPAGMGEYLPLESLGA